MNVLLLFGNQVNVNISVDSKHQTVQGVSFPLTDSAKDQLQKFNDRKINYVQLVRSICSLKFFQFSPIQLTL